MPTNLDAKNCSKLPFYSENMCWTKSRLCWLHGEKCGGLGKDWLLLLCFFRNWSSWRSPWSLWRSPQLQIVFSTLFYVHGERHEACGGRHKPWNPSSYFMFPLWWVPHLPSHGMSHGGPHGGLRKCILTSFLHFLPFSSSFFINRLLLVK